MFIILLNYDIGVMIFSTYKASLYNKGTNFYTIAYFGPSLHVFQLGIIFLIIYKFLIKI